MNSPWGIEYSMIKELHCTRHYLLWKISWLNLLIMRKDAPSVSYQKKDNRPKFDEEETLDGLIDDFDDV